MISENEVFSSIASEYTEISNEKHIVLRNDTFKSIEQLSYLKWLNEAEELGLSFDFGFQDLILNKPHVVNFDEYLKRVLSKSATVKTIDCAVIVDKIKQSVSPSINRFYISNGHDFMKSFAHYIKVHGNNNKITDDNISSTFRVAFTNQHLTKTSLYQNTKKWADENHCIIYPQK